MDYETIEDEISKEEKKYGLAFYLKLGFQRNLVIALVGFSIALCLLFMNFVEHYGFKFKLNFLINSILYFNFQNNPLTLKFNFQFTFKINLIF